MIEVNNQEKLQCDSCRAKVVCKETENFKKYFNEIIELRKKSSLFDAKIECPYYIEPVVNNKNSNMETKKSDDYFKNKSNKPFRNIDRDKIKITYDDKTESNRSINMKDIVNNAIKFDKEFYSNGASIGNDKKTNKYIVREVNGNILGYVYK